MRIRSIGAAVPGLRVGNAERVGRLLAANSHLDEAASRRLRRTANAMLALSGAHERRECGPGESPWTLGLEAGTQAIEQAGIDPMTLDCVISGSVGRGFLEPAMASAFASALGAKRAVAFDVAEACMGWLRAVQLAHHLIEAGTYRRVMILNVEANAQYEHLRMEDAEAELTFTLPQLTIGEAATATVLEAGGAPWPFWFRSAPGGHDLCQLPLPESARWRPEASSPLQAYRFYCRFQEMNRFTFEHFKGEYLAFLNGEVREKGRPIDHALTHASELTGWQRWAEECGLSRQFQSIYPQFGNVVSASVPLALHDARARGRLERGHGVYVYVASSGMAVGGTWFEY